MAKAPSLCHSTCNLLLQGHTQAEREDHSSRKRHRDAKDEDEDITGRPRKSQKVKQNRQKPCTSLPAVNKRRCAVEDESLPPPPRKSPGLQQIRDLKLEAPKNKRQRSVEYDDLSDHNTKRPKNSQVSQQLRSRQRRGKQAFVEDWLSESCWSRRTSADNESAFKEVLGTMPRKPASVLPSPDNSCNSVASSSRRSEKSTASVHDTDYRNSLRYRNIYVERHDPPVELVRRATRILSRPRASPELDDAAIQKLRRKSRGLQDEAEEEIVQQLGPHIVPAMNDLPDPRLARNADQPWFNSVPVPLNPNVLINPLPLPRPKPDLAFGYSDTAFTEKQLMTIDLLIDSSGRSYAIPDQKLRFPFLDIEFKSQAKNGTHYIATSQVAGAGAIALNGHMDLIQRSFGAGSLDPDEPQFFSLTMDHAYAQINVHWLSCGVEDGSFSFHVEGLSRHFLDDPVGIRAVVRAVKNVLDYGSNERLQKLCEALNVYRQKVILEKEAMIGQRNQGHNGPLQQEQGRENKNLSHKQHEHENPVVPRPLHDQQDHQSTGAQQLAYDQRGNGSRPDVRLGKMRSTNVEEGRVNGSLNGPPKHLQDEERPQRRQTTARRQERSQASTSATVRRTSSRLASKVDTSG